MNFVVAFAVDSDLFFELYSKSYTYKLLPYNVFMVLFVILSESLILNFTFFCVLFLFIGVMGFDSSLVVLFLEKKSKRALFSLNISIHG